MPAPFTVVALVVFALLFSFLNGAKDGANALATIIASRAVSLRTALWMVGIAEFAGPFIFGVAVARTIGPGVVDQQAISVVVMLATLISAGVWNILTWRLSIPTSSSHALIGGLVGAVLTRNNLHYDVLRLDGLIRIGVGLFVAPVIGLISGYLVTQLARSLLRGATPGVNWFFKRAQIVTTLGLALSHGANDAPKAMGITALGLVASGLMPEFAVPLWLMLITAGALALGTMLGSRRLIRTLGTRFYRIRPFQAFNTQLSAGLIVVAASVFGSPVSTSQVMSSAIAGVGAAERLTKVRWGIMGEIILGWLLTIPATALAGGITYWLISRWLGP